VQRALLVVLAAGCAAHPPARIARPALEEVAPRDDLKAWWIGHATVLIEMGDRWILTDPNFSESVGMVVHRKVEPGIDLDALPEVDCVLISHAHLDHLDKPSLRRIGEQASVVAPPGAATALPKIPFRSVTPLDAWQSVEQDGMRITAVPARHGDSRYGFDVVYRNHAHTGYVVEYAGMTVFFAGDTGYDPKSFREIGRRFPKIDLALIPVGPSGNRFFRPFMRAVHVNPAEALRIFDEVHARWMIPIHFGTFFQASPSEMAEIQTAIRKHPRGDRVLLLRQGESAEIARDDQRTTSQTPTAITQSTAADGTTSAQAARASLAP
jgi:N-acyl-phosphatidylethanolamine-hydrolysing phospholipase D